MLASAPSLRSVRVIGGKNQSFRSYSCTGRNAVGGWPIFVIVLASLRKWIECTYRFGGLLPGIRVPFLLSTSPISMSGNSRGMAVPAMDDGNHGRDARATKAIRGRPVQTERSDVSQLTWHGRPGHGRWQSRAGRPCHKAIRGRPVQTERSDMSPDAGALHSRHSILLRR
jgi:hypothetical protein